MKFTVVLAFLASTVVGFQAPHPAAKSSSLAMATQNKKGGGNPMEELLRRLSNNFEPIHGHGSLENDLDEQWEAQQELLRKRRANNLDKAHLKQKYADPSKVKFDGRIGDSTKSSFGQDLSP
jgi:hypothetical protein